MKAKLGHTSDHGSIFISFKSELASKIKESYSFHGSQRGWQPEMQLIYCTEPSALPQFPPQPYCHQVSDKTPINSNDAESTLNGQGFPLRKITRGFNYTINVFSGCEVILVYAQPNLEFLLK